MSLISNSNLDSLIARRHELIPGGAHTYSKGDDQFPGNAPAAIMKGSGAYVTGSDGKEYIDWCMGLRAVLLGHCYPTVQEAVRAQMDEGTNFGRPHYMEFVLADLLVSKLPHVQMVKFAKNGSTATTAATKLARAFTGRNYIAACNHPFFSYDDWFIGTTPCASGIPEEIKNLTLQFRYNDIESLKKLFAEHPNQIACVIMEAMTVSDPKDNFLQEVQALAKKEGAVFIIDEMITGFRYGIGGATARYGLAPDLVTYGKGIANGYSLSVLGGRRDIMELGGLTHTKPRVFLISTTHGAETVPLAAAYATIQTMIEQPVAETLWKNGELLAQGLNDLISRESLAKYVEVVGFPSNLSLSFKDHDGTTNLVLKTIFLQEMIKAGVLFQGYFAISFSHGQAEIEKTLAAVAHALPVYRTALEDVSGREKYLLGPAVKPVFREYN